MIRLKEVPSPKFEENLVPVMLSDKTMNQRKEKVLAKMQENNYDALILYADLEHGSNFEYLTGFIPRFEEAMLVLESSGKAYIILGNENLNKASKSRIKATAIHMPHLSLPNQPMETTESVEEIIAKCGIQDKKNIGIIGWKNFVGTKEAGSELFDLPAFLLNAFQLVCKDSIFSNATRLFIGEKGVRTTNNANEFAHYEFGAALSGRCMLEAMNDLAVDKTEMDIASKLSSNGQHHNVVTIMAAGERFVQANIYPTNKKISIGDTISMTTSYKGGLHSQGGCAVNNKEELPENQQDYLAKVAIPYYNAFKTWLETIKIGLKGKDLYDTIDKVFPKKEYGWYLNPGHLCADEEWLSSPIYSESEEVIKSGMLFQIDIIPSVKGFGGVSCESGVFIADANLREQIQRDYPLVWERIVQRKEYMTNCLGFKLSEEVLPTSAMTAYLRPYLLNKSMALTNCK